ncbi:MAG: aminotransferase class I/II-fold pyridoxal phosphate-dependent enzyme, partial [Pseudomonadota bacterium]
ALCLVSGHATNVTLLGTLLGNEDMVILDAYAHNSLHEGARLSGAARRVFAHNDLDALSRLLAAERRRHRHVLIAVEGLYSMDGDTPDLPRLVELKDRYDAWLLVDEAHALGVTGPGGAGTASAQGVEPTAVEIWMGTLSKTLAATGGYVAGNSTLVDYLRHTAPGFVFSVGLPPPLAAGAAAALSILQAEPDRHDALAANGALFRDAALCAGLDTGLSEGHAITPILVGSSLHAVALAERLFDAGIYAGPIVHPAVPENQARLRFFLTALHQPAEIEAAVETIARLRHDLDAWIERRADDARQSTRAPSDGGRPRAHGSGAR